MREKRWAARISGWPNKGAVAGLLGALHMGRAREGGILPALAAVMRCFDLDGALPASRLGDGDLAFAARAFVGGVLVEECCCLLLVSSLVQHFAVFASDGDFSACLAAVFSLLGIGNPLPRRRWPVRASSETGKSESAEHHRESCLDRFHRRVCFWFVFGSGCCRRLNSSRSGFCDSTGIAQVNAEIVRPDLATRLRGYEATRGRRLSEEARCSRNRTSLAQTLQVARRSSRTQGLDEVTHGSVRTTCSS